MNFCSSFTLQLAAVAVATGLLLLPFKLSSAQYANHRLPTCPADVASLGGIQSGARPTNFSVQDRFMEIEFKLNFESDSHPHFIDQGVRLEVRLSSEDSSISHDWHLIRYYTPSLVVPNGTVELSSSNESVTDQALQYNSSFPLLLVNLSKLFLIREYICGQFVQNFSQGMELELRWMQILGIRAKRADASWILDDINIRIWNETCILHVFSEDFSSYEQDSYDVRLGQVQQGGNCGSTTNYCLRFRDRSHSKSMGSSNSMENSTRYRRRNHKESSRDMDTSTGTESPSSSDDSDIMDSSRSGDREPTRRYIIVNLTDISWSSESRALLAAPNVTTTNSPLEAFDINSTLILMCSFEGVPLPSLKWTHNGQPLSSRNDSITITTTTSGLSSGTSTLQWVNASTNTVGTFTCVATNNLGSADRSFNVKIRTELTTLTSMLITDTTSTTSTAMIATSSFQSTPTPGGKELLRQSIRNFKKELCDLKIEYNGSIPQEIIDTLIASATDAIQEIIKGAGPKLAGIMLEQYDLIALSGCFSSRGRFSNNIFTLVVRGFLPEEFMNPKKQLEGFREPEGAISLPGELLSAFASYTSEDRGIRCVFFIFKNLSGVVPEGTDDNNMNLTRLGSPVLSATLECMGRSCNTSNYMLETPVIIEIHHFSETSGNEMPGCFFFDLEKNLWSSRGCNRNSTLSNSSFSVCECNHLTHFAILLSPGIEINTKDKFALETISYVGVAFSVFCMIATIFTLTFLKELWGMRTFIHVNLCVCLSISQVIFVAAVDQTALEELCQTIAIVLHYFFLATFMWMLMEGVVLYIVLICVFIKKPHLYIISFTVVSYGLPALYVFCVAVPLGLTIKDDQGRPQYGSSSVSQTCWLRYDTHFIWAFITPVLVIIIEEVSSMGTKATVYKVLAFYMKDFLVMINIGFFIMAVSIMCKHNKQVRDNSKLINASHWLKTIISLVVVMGITWVIGVLVFHEALIFVAYIFAITTAFQGTFIFFLFVVMSKQETYGDEQLSTDQEENSQRPPESTSQLTDNQGHPSLLVNKGHGF